jgi:hypothetical protein
MRAKARDHTALVRRLQDALDGASTGKTKAWWERYLKGAIEFRGVGLTQIRLALADWRSDAGVGSWALADQFALALRLFEEPMAEDKLADILTAEVPDPHEGCPTTESSGQHFASALMLSVRPRMTKVDLPRISTRIRRRLK